MRHSPRPTPRPSAGSRKRRARRCGTTSASWLAYAERACTEDAEPQQSDYVEDQYNCVHSNIYNRIRELEQSRMIDGWRFYLVEDFSVLKADQEESGSTFNTVATKVYSSPRIDGDDKTATEFNAFAETLLQTVMTGAMEGGGPNDRTSDIDTRLKVTDATSQRITITINDWWYGHGAAHGNYAITYAHFLPPEGRALMTEDVFAVEGWVEPVAKLAMAALKASLGENLWDDLDASVAESIANPAHWNFSQQGLIVQFQPYEVTAYAAGAPTIIIPWAQLEPYTAGTLFAYY